MKTLKPPFILISAVISTWASGDGSVQSSSQSGVIRDLDPIWIDLPFDPNQSESQSTFSGEIHKRIEPASGTGAAPIDPRLNDLGVSFSNMQKEEDLSSEREQYAQPLSVKASEDRSQMGKTQILGDFSRDQKLKATHKSDLLWGKSSGLLTSFSGGLSRDSRDLVFYDNRGTQFNTDDDGENSISRFKNTQFLSLDVRTQDSTFVSLLDLDFKQSSLEAVPRSLGETRAHQGNLTLLKAFDPKVEILGLGGLRAQSNDFSVSGIESNKTNSFVAGAEARVFPFAPTQGRKLLGLSARGSREQFDRRGSFGNQTQFSRNYAKAAAKSSDQTLMRFGDSGLGLEATTHLGTEFFQDQSRLNALQSSEWIWDAGATLSTLSSQSIGGSVSARRYSLIPSATSRFGDGGLLLDSPGLPPETGVRLSAGPWAKWGNESPERGRAAIQVFSEDSENAPVVMGVSPVAARTLPIGGVWTRGVSLDGEQKYFGTGLKGNLTYQNAVNASSVNWQSGQPIPGRPDWNAGAELSQEFGKWLAAIDYHYQSEDALDLAGLWARPARHSAGAKLGYGFTEGISQHWSVMLVGKNLILSPDSSDPLLFNGGAGPNLLEPEQIEREVRLMWMVTL